MNGDDSVSDGSARRKQGRIPGERQRLLLTIFATSDRPLSTTDVAAMTGQTLGATAHHVRALAAGGYLTWSSERRVRGARQTFYVASPEALRALRVPRVTALLELTGMVGDACVQPGGSVRAVLPMDWSDEALHELEKIVEDVRPRLAAILQQILDDHDGSMG